MGAGFLTSTIVKQVQFPTSIWRISCRQWWIAHCMQWRNTALASLSQCHERYSKGVRSITIFGAVFVLCCEMLNSVQPSLMLILMASMELSIWDIGKKISLSFTICVPPSSSLCKNCNRANGFPWSKWSLSAFYACMRAYPCTYDITKISVRKWMNKSTNPLPYRWCIWCQTGKDLVLKFVSACLTLGTSQPVFKSWNFAFFWLCLWYFIFTVACSVCFFTLEKSLSRDGMAFLCSMVFNKRKIIHSFIFLFVVVVFRS